MKNTKTINPLESDNVCRICIVGRIRLREIYSTSIPKMIESCSTVQVSEYDGLPHKICEPCFLMLNKCYIFRNKIEKNDKIFRQLLENKSINSKDLINIALQDADIPSSSSSNESKDFLSINNQTSVNSDSLNLPPLVPITEPSIVTVEKVSRILPKDTPPLVPITPNVNIEELPNLVGIEYKCHTCQKTFKNVLELKDHKVQSCRPKDLQCQVCLKQFTEQKKLISHLKGHTVRKDHVCKICGKSYPNYSTLTVHLRSHTGERPFKCPVCQKGFKRWAEVKLHMKTHEDDRPYVCEICSKSFKIASNFERHKKIHFDFRIYSCRYCDRSFNQLSNLTMHVRSNHTNERPFLCNVCGKCFVNSTRLKRHLRIHSGNKPYRCRNCPKTFCNGNDLKNHEIRHTGKNVNEFKNYSCDVCSKKFFHPCRLAKHKIVHQKWSACVICKKKLPSKAFYKEHLMNEHGFDECEDERFTVVSDEVVIGDSGNVDEII